MIIYDSKWNDITISTTTVSLNSPLPTFCFHSMQPEYCPYRFSISEAILQKISDLKEKSIFRAVQKRGYLISKISFTSYLHFSVVIAWMKLCRVFPGFGTRLSFPWQTAQIVQTKISIYNKEKSDLVNMLIMTPICAMASKILDHYNRDPCKEIV